MRKTGVPAARNACMHWARWRNGASRCGASPPGTTESSKQTSHDAGSGTDGVFPQTWGHLVGGHIRPHHVLAHGGACDAVLDRILPLLDQVRVCDCRLCASASGLADAASRRILGELLAFLPAVFAGVRIACEDLRDGADAALPQCDRCECGTAAAVLF